ncbi:MAG: hypothetical protein KDI13_02165 [Alphaproteobacteria bacterium]|nr:hypothetical protein [Alphaproteobacteria bacterium]
MGFTVSGIFGGGSEGASHHGSLERVLEVSLRVLNDDSLDTHQFILGLREFCDLMEAEGVIASKNKRIKDTVISEAYRDLISALSQRLNGFDYGGQDKVAWRKEHLHGVLGFMLVDERSTGTTLLLNSGTKSAGTSHELDSLSRHPV